MINGKVTGDLTGTGCVAGNGEPAAASSAPTRSPPCRSASRSPPPRAFDADGDGFSDCEEYRGRDFNGDDVVDMTLPDADPTRRDLYVEVDYMAGRRAGEPGVYTDVENAFDIARMTNPQTGATGITLHLSWRTSSSPFVNDIDFSDTADRPPGANNDFDDVKSGLRPSPAAPGARSAS